MVSLIPEIPSTLTRNPVRTVHAGYPLDMGQLVTVVTRDAPNARALLAGVVTRQEPTRCFVWIPALSSPGAEAVLVVRALRSRTGLIHGWATAEGFARVPSEVVCDNATFQPTILGSLPGRRTGLGKARTASNKLRKVARAIANVD